MQLSSDLSNYTQWSGYTAIACLFLTILAFIFQWNFRFRLFGVTSFMTVLTAGLFALGLGLFVRTEIPNAARYALVYDNGATQTVIAVPSTIDPNSIEPTLRQAAIDLFSFGRAGAERKMTIRMRTILHPTAGVSQPLYLGQVRRSLGSRLDDNLEIEIFSRNVAQLPPNKSA
jgi:hypothetical protein